MEYAGSSKNRARHLLTNSFAHQTAAFGVHILREAQRPLVSIRILAELQD